MSRHHWILLFATISCLCGLVSCQEPRDSSLVVHTLVEPEDLHPTNGTSALRTDVNLYIHSTLVKLDYESGTLVPCLAQALPAVSPDGLSFSYALKKEARWDDGTAMTGYDVAFTAKANQCLLTDNPGLKPYWENVKDISVDEKDPGKFIVHMKRPYILNTWFWADFPIIEEAFYDRGKALHPYSSAQLCDSAFISGHSRIKAWADTFNSGKYYSDPDFISGAGPYKITHCEKGASLTLEKKKNHWTAQFPQSWFCQAGPGKIIFKVNANSAATELEFKNGLMDVSTMIDISSFADLKQDEQFNKNYTAGLSDTYNYTYIALNMKPDGIRHKRIFDDILVRKAVALLTPYEQINKLLYENRNKRAVGPIAAAKRDFNTSLLPLNYDPKRAAELLAQSGWTDSDHDQVLDKKIDGETVKLEIRINYLSTQKQWEDLAKQLVESMKQAGIALVLNPVDYPSFVAAATTHDFDMSIGAWQSSAQPEDFSQLWASVSWKDKGLNFTGFGNAASDALIDSINGSVDENKRMALSRKFQKLVYDEQPYIFLFAQTRRVIVSKKWANLKIYNEYPGVLLNTLTLKE